MKNDINEFRNQLGAKNAIKIRQVHLLLNQLYYARIFGEEELHELEKFSLNKLKEIEKIWIQQEQKYCLAQYDCTLAVHNADTVKSALEKHAVFYHPLFSYLEKIANLYELKQFILNDAVLNLEFFDYLALAIVGVSDQAKAEIVKNIWDEAGRGEINYFHTTLFKNVISALGLSYNREKIIAEMPWQGLVGINLFSHFSLYSFNKMKYFGLLAATELLDPPHYHQLLKGFSRLLPNHFHHFHYYKEHEIIDVEHANGWLEKVILPELKAKPYKTKDFWLGFYMRLDSAKQYYDALLTQFSAKCAA